MGKSVLEEYIGKKADKYADRVNDDFCQIKNKQIQNNRGGKSTAVVSNKITFFCEKIFIIC